MYIDTKFSCQLIISLRVNCSVPGKMCVKKTLVGACLTGCLCFIMVSSQPGTLNSAGAVKCLAILVQFCVF